LRGFVPCSWLPFNCGRSDDSPINPDLAAAIDNE
jgi:hypothetical protein